jgi:lipoate-protein ligase A
MAFDQALLESAASRNHPVLRFYSWSQPAASYGYFQQLQHVQQLTRLRPLVRRPTGGGIVPHVSDWTYSLVFPPSHSWHKLRATQSYERVHAWIRDAFTQLQLETSLASNPQRSPSGLCFTGAELNDLLCRNRKIAGAAQRRNRLGLLIQGSIQPPDLTLAKIDWQQALCDVATRLWNVHWQPLEPTSDLALRTEDLARSKYSLPDYLVQV